MNRPDSDGWVWRAVYGITLALVVAAFLFSLRMMLNPFLLFVLLVVLASPFAGLRTHVLLVVAAGVLTTIWMLTALGSLLAPFFLALGFAYVLRPVVRRVEGRRVSRGLAIALISLPALVAVGLALFLGIPALAREVAQFVAGVPRMLQAVTAWLERMQHDLARRDIPFVDEGQIVARMRALRPEVVLQWVQGRQSEIASRAWGAVMGAGRGIGLLLNVLGYVFLTPVLTFYLLRDWEGITAGALDLVPVRARPGVAAFLREYDRLLAGYLRGNFLESAIVGALTWLGLWVSGIPSALLLGVVAAVFNLIPYVGLILTLIPALLVALFTANVGASIVKVLVVFAVVQALDGAIIGPKVVGESVDLHPVLVVLSLSVFSFFFGFVGLLLAVPLAVLVKLLVRAGLSRYRRSAVYRGAAAAG